jgi:anti-sigma factor RsiW
MIGVPQLTTASIEDEVVTSHVRSLLADHVTDVAASSRHVVKPWFAGRIDYAPPVPDLADAGFTLVGGRLDYVDRHPVPAIVYRRQLHVINLFVLPSSSRAPARTARTSEDGYNLVAWQAGGLRYWAVSDVEAAELDRFQRTFAARAAAPAGTGKAQR